MDVENKTTTETRNSFSVEFSCLKAEFFVQRRIGYHLVQTVLPAVMIVMISWVSFWIDPRAAPARVALSVTTLLTLTTQAAAVRMTLPPVSYGKAIDFWMGFNTFMVFAVLLEYAIVNSVLKGEAVPAKAVWKRMSRMVKNPSEEIKLNTEEDDNKKEPELPLTVRKAGRVDQAAKIVFPLSFALFNFIYWLILLVT